MKKFHWNLAFYVLSFYCFGAGIMVAQLAGWLSSVLIQIPIQLQLDKGKDMALLEKLIMSDWIRVFAWVLYIIIVIAMLYRIRKSYLHKRAMA